MQSPSFLVSSLFVAVGGGLGAWLRFVIGKVIGTGPFPWATVTVNALGSLAMGLLAGWLARRASGPSEHWRLLLGVGLLGGFTTFSAFSLDIVQLAQRGAMAMATLYIALSVALGAVGLLLGLRIMA